MAQLSLTLLGCLQITLDSRPITAFESDKARALLAYLALEAERPHRRDALAGLLWPERPERAAHLSLNQALSNLRQVIGDRSATAPFLLITSESIQFDRVSDHTSTSRPSATCWPPAINIRIAIPKAVHPAPGGFTRPSSCMAAACSTNSSSATARRSRSGPCSNVSNCTGVR